MSATFFSKKEEKSSAVRVEGGGGGGGLRRVRECHGHIKKNHDFIIICSCTGRSSDSNFFSSK